MTGIEHKADMSTAWPGDYDDEITCTCGDHSIAECIRAGRAAS